MNGELKKIVCRLGVLTFVFILFLLCLKSIFGELMMRNTIFYRADLQFHEEGISSEIVFVGDSHTQYDVDPRFIDEAFNWGFSAESYLLTFYKVQYLLRNNEDLKIILASFDLHSFASARAECCSNYWFWSGTEYVTYEELGSLDENLSYIGYLLYKNLPFLGNGNLLLRLVFLDTREVLSGHVASRSIVDFASLSPEERVKEAKMRVDKHFRQSEVVFFDKVHDSFVDTVDLALKKEVKVVLVQYPVSKEYFEYLNENYIEDIGFFEEMALEGVDLGKVEILDYRNVFFENPEYFADPDHLNRAGVEAFMEILGEDIESMK
jgi:hypothetical protein